jgi:protein OS-9
LDICLHFAQYEVLFPETYILENEATVLLSQTATSSTNAATPESQETQDLSRPDKASASPSPNDLPLEHMYEAVVADGQRYLCSIPVIPEEEPQNATASAEEAKAAEEKELMRATDRGWELLEGMQGNCIYYLSGWWSYSFCYKGEIKQFHSLDSARGIPRYPPVEDTSVKSFVLGRFPAPEKKAKAKEARKTLGSEAEAGDVMDDEGNTKPGPGKGLELAKLETHGATRYMVQRLTDGTECDLTGRPRKIEVQVCLSL